MKLRRDNLSMPSMPVFDSDGVCQIPHKFDSNDYHSGAYGLTKRELAEIHLVGHLLSTSVGADLLLRRTKLHIEAEGKDLAGYLDDVSNKIPDSTSHELCALVNLAHELAEIILER